MDDAWESITEDSGKMEHKEKDGIRKKKKTYYVYKRIVMIVLSGTTYSGC